MAVVDLCTAQDVYVRAGGQPALAKLIDPQGTGLRDTLTLNTAIRDATNKVVAAAGVQVFFAGLTQPQIAERHPELVSLAARLAVVYCWQFGSRGQAVPEYVIAMQTECEAELERLSVRRRKHGAMGYEPAISQRVTVVENDREQTRMTLESFKGFI